MVVALLVAKHLALKSLVRTGGEVAVVAVATYGVGKVAKAKANELLGIRRS
jgi:hypothetical protein